MKFRLKLKNTIKNFFINLINTKGGRHSGGTVGKALFGFNIQDDEQNSKLVIKWHFPHGKGKSTNKESGLLRNLRYILDSGKPLGNFVYTFYEENNEHYILGTLCKSEKKLIFFPGGDSGEIIPKEGIKTTGHIDHFTLDENLETWHITLKEKAKDGTQIPKHRTWKINDNVILWFVIQANSVSNFERAPEELHTEITHTNSEARRRAIAIYNAREGSKFRICSMNKKIEEPYVINFEFFISLNGKPDLREIPLYFNKMDNQLSNKTSALPYRTHDISIPDYEPIISIRVTKIRGSHNAPWSYAPGSVFKKSIPKDFE